MKRIAVIGAAAAFAVVAATAGAVAFMGDTGGGKTEAGARKACCAGDKTSLAGKKCPAEAAPKVASKSQPTKVGQEVTLAGKVLCEHCDLGKGNSCAPVLKAEGRDGYMKICPTSNGLDEIKKAGTVEVKGFVRPGSDGQDEIEVISFSKKLLKAS